MLLLSATTSQADNWPGHAIVGNGKFCAVYSEDPRITMKDGFQGIRHFYFNDFTDDCIQTACFQLENKSTMVQKDSVVPYMADFFTPAAKHFRVNKHVYTTSIRACDEGLLMQFRPEPGAGNLTVKFLIEPTKKDTGRFISFQILRSDDDINEPGYEKSDEELAYIDWMVKGKWGNLKISGSQLPVYGSLGPWLGLTFVVSENGSLEILLAQKGYSLNTVKTLWKKADKKWNKWIRQGKLPYRNPKSDKQRLYNEYYSRNLYAAYSSVLNGNVPADVTGQFHTNGMPQLYPRDAMMVARNLLQLGYHETAAEIIRFWSGDNIPMKTPGEFYARYDARGQATDGGSGARYDEPEWDAGAYLIVLNYEYYKVTGKWISTPEKLFSCADFIVGALDSNGLLYEGGIVEWTGYLPATNMICAAALLKASEIAKLYKRNDLARKYTTAYNTIDASLPKLFDNERKLYTARRYYSIKADDNFSLSEKKGSLNYLWDVTSIFGILWGYPDHPLMHDTYRYVKENLNDNGGVKYFEATDDSWLEAYGSDLFFFATAAWAKYAVMQNDNVFAQKNIDWIIAQSNIYGLMPERVLSDYSAISEASPLTWCCAEFATAVKEVSRITK